MRSAIALGIVAFLAGCTTAGTGRAPAASSEASSPEPCSFDSQCPGGSCRFGTCSPFPPDAPRCAVDAECGGGSCQAGTCSPAPRTIGSTCTYGSDCSGGICNGIDCHQ